MTKIKKNELNDNEVIQYDERQRLAYYLDNINDCSENEQFYELSPNNKEELKDEYLSSMFEYVQSNEYLKTIVVDMIAHRVNESSFHKMQEQIDAIVKKRNEMKESA